MIIVLTAAVRKSPIINSIYYVEYPSTLRLLCRKNARICKESHYLWWEFLLDLRCDS